MQVLSPVAVPFVLLCGLGVSCGIATSAEQSGSQTAAAANKSTVRVAACQAKRRVIDFRLTPDEVQQQVDKNLAELEQVVQRAAEQKCDAIVLPEDTLGLGKWICAHAGREKDVLPEAVKRMLDRLGRAAAKHHMYLVACSSYVEAEDAVYNTAFFLGRDGKEIGRYHKVCPVYHESVRRGESFPVFPTSDLGTVGMLICYDLVVPETARCLALRGADIIFVPTLGTAAVGDDDIGVQALRVRAAENFIWLVVAHGGSGAMIISPQGKIVAKAEGPDGLAVADIDPLGAREGGDAMNWQRDMRARLFRERNSTAFGILTDPDPPVLKKVPIHITPQEARRMANRVLTVGEEEFKQADALARAGNKAEAVVAFEKLRAAYRDSWIDRVAQERLAKLRPPDSLDRAGPTTATDQAPPPQAKLPAPGPTNGGLASLFPGDEGIERDPRVLFVEDFETGSLAEIGARWGNITKQENMRLADDLHGNSPGARSLRMSDIASLYTHTPGVDTMYARFYVKFHEKTGYLHHFVALVADRTPTPWPRPGAGEIPAGDAKFSTAIEPTGRWGKFPPPGVWEFYTYWHEMKGRWGSVYDGKQALVQPGRWYCIEAMLKANSSPEKADGEQAFWVDGELYGRFGGFRWRTSDKLKINSFWLNYYTTEQAAVNNKDPDPKSRVMQVWIDDIVLATEYIGPIRGKPAGGKKKAAPSKSALLTPGLLVPVPGKPIFTEQFENGPGKFKGGSIVDGGVSGSKAYSIPPGGANVWNAFSTPVGDSTTVRFKVKPLGDANELQVMIWSKKHKDNCRYTIGGLKKGEWTQVEFRAIEARVGWARNGPSLEGDALDNLILLFQGKPADGMLLDDVEIAP